MEKKQSDFIDIQALWEDYKAHWWWFAVSVILCASLAYVYVKMHNVEYAVKAHVLVSEEEKGFAGLDMASLLGGSGNSVDDEVFVMSAHSLYKDVAKDLGLDKNHLVYTSLLGRKVFYEKYPVDVKTPAMFADTTSLILTFKIKVNDEGEIDVTAKWPKEKETIAEVEDARFPVEIATKFGVFTVDSTRYFVPGKSVKTLVTVGSYDYAAESLDEEIYVGIPGKNSQVLAVSVNTDDPGFGKKMINTIVSAYNRRGVLEKQQEGLKTIEFLDRRISLLALELDSTETDIQNYKEGLGVVDLTTEAGIAINERTSMQAKAFAANTELEILKLARDFIRDDSNKYALIPYNSDSEAVGDAIDNYNAAILERMKLKTVAKDGNIALKQLEAGIDAMRANIAVTLDKAVQNAEVTLGQVQGRIGQAKSKLSGVPLQERVYVGKARQQGLTQRLYLYLLQRREETAIMIANAIPKGVIVDEAFTLQDPVSTSKKLVLALALVFGLLIPPMILYVKKLFRTKFSSRSELEPITDIPVLGEICTDKTGASLVMKESTTSSTAELFRLVRSNLLFVTGSGAGKVVLVTSTRSGEGKSYISVNLAASFALLGKKTLLVGMDIRNPRLADYLGVANDKGLTGYLVDSSVTIDDIIRPLGQIKGLDFIQAGPVPPNPSELLQSAKVDELFETLRSRYDVIIIDSAPVGMVSDTFSLARICDATVYVCRANYTSISDIKFANSVNKAHQLPKMSLVINGTNAKKGYGYGYGQEHHRR